MAAKIIKKRRKRRRAFILALVGELGSGKTAFVKELARAFGVNRRVVSPTFLTSRKYQLPISHSQFRYLCHFDLYRIKRPRELNAIRFQESIRDPKNLVVIEWADRVRYSLPADAIWISFAHGGTEGERLVVIRGNFRI